MNEIKLDYCFKGINCVKMQTDKYFCVICPSMGASVLRLRDEKNRMEIFRYNEDVTAEQIDEQREIWGLPTLYLPNRFDGGIIKTSDGMYRLPVNEKKFNNHLHGWVHKREHQIECYNTQDEKCVLVTSYVFNKNDEMYKYFPIDFKISYRFTLSDEEGLLQEIYLTCNCQKVLPVSICTHTCINAPLTDGGSEEALRLKVPIGKKCTLTERFLPTQEFVELKQWDKEYLEGTKVPTGQVIENDMYQAVMNTYKGEAFYGVIVTDTQTGISMLNEISPEFKFWNMWNHDGDKGYFCPEPMTAMINAPNLTLPKEVSGYSEIFQGQTFKCWQRFFTD